MSLASLQIILIRVQLSMLDHNMISALALNFRLGAERTSAVLHFLTELILIAVGRVTFALLNGHFQGDTWSFRIQITRILDYVKGLLLPYRKVHFTISTLPLRNPMCLLYQHSRIRVCRISHFILIQNWLLHLIMHLW